MRTCIIYGLRPDKSITLTLQSFSDVKNEKISAPVLENSENRCLLKESALKSAGTGGRIAQSVEQGTENPRVPSSILGPATIFFCLLSGILPSNSFRTMDRADPDTMRKYRSSASIKHR